MGGGELGKYVSHVIQEIVASVADPGCLSLIPDSDFYPSRIPDPTTAAKEVFLLSYLFCSHKFHKIENYFIFE
jgi:hypothetical protein